jgi:hypothetical protein
MHKFFVLLLALGSAQAMAIDPIKCSFGYREVISIEQTDDRVKYVFGEEVDAFDLNIDSFGNAKTSNTSLENLNFALYITKNNDVINYSTKTSDVGVVGEQPEVNITIEPIDKNNSQTAIGNFKFGNRTYYLKECQALN